ncbi:uncharacterized protein LOC113351549 [Papaver somniferum]|uniref:uncharacterized protein LOC113351549 n=1 Tax=Papaver somniferum TaxID=3469 RepID=UPI000E700DAE|nr:uncharacterized protein LOC113351549 [Papaver somniferum]
MTTPLQDWDDLHLSNYQWVSQLIDSDSAQWNVSLLRQLFTPNQIFMWKTLHNAIPVKVRIFKHDNSENQLSVLCNTQQPEDVDHLFLHFPFAQAIWRYFFPQHYTSIVQHSTVLSWIQTWQSKDSYINIFNTADQIHVTLCIIHHIWKLRCRVIFSSTNLNRNTVIHHVNSYIAFHHLGNPSVNSMSINRSICVLNLPWKPPPPGHLKINIDASFNKVSLLDGIGIITRNHAGLYVMGK